MALLVVTRFVLGSVSVSDSGDGNGNGNEVGRDAAANGEGFRVRARDALAALCAQPGCRRGHVGRSMDDPRTWVMQTEWDSVGSYRRALSSFDVKVRAVPVMYEAVDELSAFEVLVAGGPEGVTDGESDLSEVAATAAPGERADR